MAEEQSEAKPEVAATEAPEPPPVKPQQETEAPPAPPVEPVKSGEEEEAVTDEAVEQVAPPPPPDQPPASELQKTSEVQAAQQQTPSCTIVPKDQKITKGLEGTEVECDAEGKAMRGICPGGYPVSGEDPCGESLMNVGSLTSIRRRLLAAPDSRVPSFTNFTYGDKLDRVKAQVMKYMNSYRLDSKNPFHRESVYKVIRDTFHDEFNEVVYEAQAFSKLCLNITAEIRSRVKALGFERYKLVCIVQLIEKNNQTVNSVAKFLWDPERDNGISYFYEGKDFVASAAVFGLYYE